jgi:beta-glucanase (GH16 family)
MLRMRRLGWLLAVVTLLTAPIPSVRAATRDVYTSGSCSMSTTWAMHLAPASGRIAVTLSLHGSLPGRTWTLRIKQNSRLVWTGQRTTNSNGDLLFTLDRPDKPGTDYFVGRARSLSTGQICGATAALEPVYTFRDEFNGSAPDSSIWRSWTGGTGTTYDSSQSAVANGELKISAVRTSSGWTSAGLDTCYGRFAQRYGYFEARMRFSAGYGAWPAFWMTEGYTAGHRNELDVSEILANPVGGTRADTSARYYATVHYDDGSGAPAQQFGGWPYNSPVDLAGGWHVYAMSWQPWRVGFYIDGVRWTSFVDTIHIPTVPMCVIFDLAMGGSWPGPTTTSTPSPSTLEVDWVRVSN